MQQVIELLQEQNRMLRKQNEIPPEPSEQEVEANEIMSNVLEERSNEFEVLRSITANSSKDVFRPIGRSAEYVSIVAGRTSEPVTAINPRAAALIESERRDPEIRQIVGVVNSFSRSSKTGTIFSRELGRSVQFEDINVGRLPPQDDYSWSQYYRLPIEMEGQFVYWFDGRIKKFLVENRDDYPQAEAQSSLRGHSSHRARRYCWMRSSLLEATRISSSVRPRAGANS